MKIRSDFVTNSSSSSFIIGKKEDTSATIESVFQTVKGFYREFLSARDAAIEYIANNPHMKMEYVKHDDGYASFKCTEKNYEKRWELEKKFEKECGIDVWDYIAPNYDWLNCETYMDYQEYWLDKMSKTDDYRVHAPFTIADFLEEREVQWLHYHFDPKYNTHTHKVNSESDVLGWYFPYIEEAFKHPANCDECKRREYCKEDTWLDSVDCFKHRKTISNNNIPEDKACLYMLGRVCIHSENSYIPEYVVNKLSEISEYSCNHMG